MSALTPAYSSTPSPLGNPGGPGLWRTKGLKLPDYIENVARGIMAGGEPDKSRAIATAIAAVKRWAAGGGKVAPEVRAAAAKAAAEWEALKAGHSHANGPGRAIDLAGPEGYVHGWIKVGAGKPDAAALRSMSPGEKKAYVKAGTLPDRLKAGSAPAVPASVKRDTVPVPATRPALIRHMTEHHSGGPAGGRRIGPRNPTAAQLRANHAQQHAGRGDLGHVHVHAAPTAARGDAAPDVTANAFSFTGRESGALLDYVSPDGSAAINGALRNGTMPAGDRAGSVKVIDGVIAKTATTRPSTVYRGMSLPPGMSLTPGAVFKDDGFISTTSLRGQAKGFAVSRSTGKTAAGVTVPGMKALGGKPVVMAIHLPAGQHMAPGQPELKEFILPRGSSFRVDSVDTSGTIHVSIR